LLLGGRRYWGIRWEATFFFVSLSMQINEWIAGEPFGRQEIGIS
jgi:hypothetical protein